MISSKFTGGIGSPLQDPPSWPDWILIMGKRTQMECFAVAQLRLPDLNILNPRSEGYCYRKKFSRAEVQTTKS